MGKFFFFFFPSLAIPQYGLLSHINSFRLSSGHSGLVLYPKHRWCSPLFPVQALLSVADLSIWATSLLAVAVRRIFCGFFFFFFSFFPPSYIALWDSQLPTDPSVRGFLTVWKFLLHDSLPRMDLRPSLFCLSFCLLYFVLPPFKENGLPFWVPGVLRQHTDIVLWKLFSIQICIWILFSIQIFWWICGGESGLSVLFLCHLGTTPRLHFSV